MVNDDTATAGTLDNATSETDYIISGDTETIAINTREDTVSVPIRGDDAPELNETFTITLTNPVGASLLNSAVKGTINNDDEPVLTIADATLLEGVSGAISKMQFTVSTFPLSNTEITANWATSSESDDTATAGVDYTSATGIVRIPPNTSSSTFEVDILGDYAYEIDETFTVTLSSPSANAHIISSANSATGTIRNDDPEIPLPVISISSDATTTGVTEGYSFEFEIESDIALPGAQPLVVSFSVTDASTGAMVEGTTVQIPGNRSNG